MEQQQQTDLKPEWWKKYAGLLLMLFLIVLPFAWYLKRNLARLQSTDNQSTAVKLIQNADAWNVLIMLATFAICIIFFIATDILYGWILKLLSKKRNLAWLNSWFFQFLPRRIMTLVTLVFLFAVGANSYIIYMGVKRTVKSPGEINSAIPALVLGTSKHFQAGPNKGKENKYFTYRMDAARALWEAGKVNEFIVSGDKTGQYDETRDMKEDLIALGVPPEKVKIDTSGLRTMDSMLRLRNVFHINECFIVSQDFHVWRALFQAYFYGMKAHGYYASGTSTFNMIRRECQARPKAVIDLLFLNMLPRDKMDKDLTEHRKKFEINSDLALMLVGTISIAVICAIGAGIKYMG